MADQATIQEPAVPVLLLKTRSTPCDTYYDEFTAAQLPNGRRLAPIFVPVMLHKFDDDGLSMLRSLLRERQISNRTEGSFGGMIFTSQRSVEAFAHVVKTEMPTHVPEWPHLQDVPIYSVGPATTRALSAVSNNVVDTGLSTLAPPPGGPRALRPNEGLVWGNAEVTYEDVEMVVAALIQQGLMHGFVAHGQSRFAVIGAKAKGSPLLAGWPNVWQTIQNREYEESFDLDEVPGWVKG
ncbi:hypothetical protein NLG97_g42 [Lecanicillium saksenae]|uniref:Uncharacterized protein n=1 Tax=Lecanicillium saksenae TaxID=468837 RepID=A0ACC1RAC2_9HYPO|nr:hypothetical protein NLG97_g42 [Lecanicillium saksenae]